MFCTRNFRLLDTYLTRLLPYINHYQVYAINTTKFLSICMYVCMYVCLKLNNSGTAGPIWLSLFLLAPSWSRDGFRLKKFQIRGPVFPKIRKNLFWREIIKYFCKKYSNFHVENRRNNT